jgi:glycerol-3-phosphate dehydrogenase
MATNPNQKLAVLIDADNAQASVIQELLAEVSRYGTATIKRAYGDWTTTNLRGWKDVLHTMASRYSSSPTPAAKTPPTRP